MFADLVMAPGSVVAWLIVGLISGWLTGLFMRGTGYGILMDIVVGLVGAFLGGLIFSLFVQGDTGFWGSIAVSFLGGCFLVALLRLITPRATI